MLALLILPGAATLMSVLSAVRRPIDDPDVFWIAAAGRELLRHGSLLRENHFSFTAPHAPWVMHEWLLGPLYAWGLSHIGSSFFALSAALVVIALAALLLFATPGTTTGRLFAAALFLPLFGVHLVSARPMVLALLPVAAMVGLAFAPGFGKKHLVLALLLELVWVNIHGSFPLGPLLLVAGALDASRDRRMRLMAAGGAVLAMALQPHGLALFALVLSYVGVGAGAAEVARARLLEFQPLLGEGFRFVSPTAFVGLALLMLVALWLLAKRRAFVRVALFGLTLAMALSHARHADLAGLVGAMIVLPAAVDARPWATSIHSASRTRIVLLLPAVLLAPVALFAPPLVNDSLGGADLPRLLAQVPDGAQVYTPFALGGRTEWLAADRGVRVFYDSRNDCYPDDVARLAFDLEDGRIDPVDAVEALRREGTTYLLVGHRSPLAQSQPSGRIASEGGLDLYAL